MNRPDLTLTGAVEGLLLRGSPVNVDFLGLAVPGVYTAPDTRPANQRNGPHLVAPVDCWPEDFNGSSEMIRSCKSEETTLDLTHPLGLATALHYLRERGHDPAWAARWPEVVAWSVIAVSRGGPVIVEVLSKWDDEHDARWGRNGCAVCMSSKDDDDFCVMPLGWRFGWPSHIQDRGPETGDLGRAKADAAALAASYGLLNEDGSLQLPQLPDVPNVD